MASDGYPGRPRSYRHGSEENPEMSVLLITHYQRLLNFIKPDVVHVMVDGKIVRTGGPDVAVELEAEGYADYREYEKA